MEHLVKFTSAEGRDGFHTAASLDDALKFVERLRNSEEVEHVKVHRLQEVPIEFKAYYKVEIRGAEPKSASQPEDAVAAPEPLPAPGSPGDGDDAGLVAASDGGRRLFGRG